MIKKVHLVYRLVLLLGLLLVLVPFQILALLFWRRTSYWIPVFAFRAVLWLLNTRLQITGTAAPEGTFIIANHIHFYDIIVMGAVCPMIFVAKSDVKSWPVLNWLSMLNRTIFVIRKRGKHTVRTTKEISQHLNKGLRVVVYPEGTTGNGTQILPFKSTLFSAPLEVAKIKPNHQKSEPVQYVQPVTIAYIKEGNIRMGWQKRAYFAWLGDESFISAVGKLFTSSGLTINLRFHAPIKMDDTLDRKTLSDMCHAQIVTGMAEALSDKMESDKPRSDKTENAA